MTNNGQQTFYIFIDESGNFDFSPSGTRYFTMTAFCTTEPVVNREKLIGLRYEKLKEGYDVEYFHASEDKQIVRDEVFKVLKDMIGEYEVHSVVAQKNKTNPSIYRTWSIKNGRPVSKDDGIGLYAIVCRTLLQHIFRNRRFTDTGHIVVVLGSIFTKKKHNAILKTLKTYLKDNQPHTSFNIYFHQTCADINCQLADYCCWAVSVKNERNELRSYSIIKNTIKSEFDIFRLGNTEYYKYKDT